MLSSTYEIEDIKYELQQYDYYGYKDKSFALVGDITTGSASITGLSSTASLKEGMGVSGVGVGASATIESIDGTTSITLSVISTATTTDLSITFSQSGDDNFESLLTRSIETAMYERMLPLVGETEYDTIEALDKTGLTTEQTYVYRAEVYFSVAEFFLWHSRQEKARRNSRRESRSVDNSTISHNSGQTGKEWAADEFIMKAKTSLNQAGYYTTTTLSRGRSIHRQSDVSKLHDVRSDDYNG